MSAICGEERAAMEITTIQDEAHYEAALAELRRMWGAAPGTADGDYLDSLMDMVDDWEGREGGKVAVPPHY
jgi:hypothetical protein